MLSNLAKTLHSSAKLNNKQVAKIWGHIGNFDQFSTPSPSQLPTLFMESPPRMLYWIFFACDIDLDFPIQYFSSYWIALWN